VIEFINCDENQMKRMHALEWEDLRWFPASWRDYGTDYLRFVATKSDLYKPIVPLIRKGLQASGGRHWVDCASGGGSSLIMLAKALHSEFPDLKITLTDYYPNIRAFERTRAELKNVFNFEKQPVNVMEMPPHLQGKFTTLFGAFHHFRPDDARKILQNAVDTQSPIAIFEPVGRNAISWFSMLFVMLNVLLFTPFIRPLRWKVLPFIYLLPLVPLYVLWDGIASILRTYSEKEMKELVASLRHSDAFEWEIGKTAGALPVQYLLGIKKEHTQ